MLYTEEINPILRRLQNKKKILNLGGNPFPCISRMTPDIEKQFGQELDKEIKQLKDLLKTAKSVYDF